MEHLFFQSLPFIFNIYPVYDNLASQLFINNFWSPCLVHFFSALFYHLSTSTSSSSFSLSSTSATFTKTLQVQKNDAQKCRFEIRSSIHLYYMITSTIDQASLTSCLSEFIYFSYCPCSFFHTTPTMTWINL